MRFHKIIFQTDTEDFKKSFFPKKYDIGHSQYQNKKLCLLTQFSATVLVFPCMADDSYSNSKELGKSLGKTLGSFKFVLCRLGTKNTIDDLQTYLLAPYFSICLFMNLNFKLSNHRVFCKPISDLFR